MMRRCSVRVRRSQESHRVKKLVLPFVVLSLVAFGACHGREGAISPSAQFNDAPIILISIDTLRSDRLSVYGATRVTTPYFDQLAKESLVFEHAYSQCPLTLPSHLSILSGLLPQDHEVRDNIGFRFDAVKHPTLPTLLKERGYATGAAVSAYVLRRSTGIAVGFDEYDD